MQDPKNRHLGTIAHLCRAISLQLRHLSTIGKKFFSSNISSTCPHNIVNFGPLAAEICWQVWGTPANFNGFRVLAALLHGNLDSSSGRQLNFAALNRGRHLYSAGRPSRWALAHISSLIYTPKMKSWVRQCGWSKRGSGETVGVPGSEQSSTYPVHSPARHTSCQVLVDVEP